MVFFCRPWLVSSSKIQKALLGVIGTDGKFEAGGMYVALGEVPVG